jgi:hypothetical protein
MPERWIPVVSEDGNVVYSDAVGLQEVQAGLDKAARSPYAVPVAVPKGPPWLGNGVQVRTMTESKYPGSTTLEWIQGNFNNTTSFLLLGFILLAAANRRFLGFCLDAAFQHFWQTLCGIAGILCIVSAFYPWIAPLQSHLRLQSRVLFANIQVGHLVVSCSLMMFLWHPRISHPLPLLSRRINSAIQNIAHCPPTGLH